MKKLILFLALLPAMVYGQKITGEVDLSNYPTRAEMHKAIADAIGKPVKEKCKEGPVPVAITKITSTSANVTWHGKDVKELTWKIVSQSDSNIVYATGKEKPQGNQFPISYPGTPPGQYRLVLIGESCDGIGGRNFSIAALPPPVVLPPCLEGPVIKEVKNVMPSGVTIIFHGKEVRKLVVDTRQAGKLIQSDTISPSSSELTIRYKEGLTPGTYLLKISGVSCAGGGIESFPFEVSQNAGGGGVIPNPSVGQRQIYMNTTGYGFDFNDPTGIDEGWRNKIIAFSNLTYNGVKFSGITGVRLAVRWYEYEPTPGVYRDKELQRAIDWIKSRGLRISVCFLAVRKKGDGMVPETDKLVAIDNNYVALDHLGEYAVSPNSQEGNRKLKAVAKRLTERLQASGVLDYVSMGYGNTEEFYMPIIKDEKQEKKLFGTGYNQVDKTAWSKWLSDRGYEQIPVQAPWNFEDPYEVGGFWNTPNGHKWYDFITDALANMHYAFRDGVHEAGGKVCGYYADTGGAQSAWYMMYRLDKIFAGCDYVYSTDGGTKWDIIAKLQAVDFIRGTFPNAIPAIEFDALDLAPYEMYNYDPLPFGSVCDWGRMRQYSESAFQRGVGLIHLAMAFSDGTDSNSEGDNINPSAEALWYLRNNYLEAENIPDLPKGEAIMQQVTNYSGEQPYKKEWHDRGGGLDLQIPIVTY